jgi:DNA-binding response OmpR family regulator
MAGAMVESERASRTGGGSFSPSQFVDLASANAGGAEFTSDPVLRFRRFTVLRNARQLLADGVPVNLGSRAFDLLLVLLQARGQIVSKAEIFKHVWPSTTVDESNLRFQMTSLRALLGKDRDIIKTIPGRGYLLIAEAFSDAPAQHAETPHCGKYPQDFAASEHAARNVATQPMVAIIDDDHGVRESLEGLLMSAGMTTRSFGSVQEFRGQEWAEPPACLILDVWLPGTSGIDFNNELIAEGKQPPVIFISGHADVHTSVRAMKAGAVEFLTKPVRHQELLDAIQSVLAN